MNRGLAPVDREVFLTGLEEELVPHLAQVARTRSGGHCMRVSDLDRDLMVRLAGRLAAEVPTAVFVVLIGDRERLNGVPESIGVTGTKLVELRNPLPDGNLRPPLMVFAPNDLRVAAEDSFGIATFEEVPVGHAYEQLAARLLQESPLEVRGAIEQLIELLRQGDTPWPYADPVGVTRFLLTAKTNGFDGEAVGASLFELGLIPDFQLLARPETVLSRVSRNRDCVKSVTWSSKTERGRALDLGLKDRSFRKSLADFFSEAGVDDPKQWTRRIVDERAYWPLAFQNWEFEDGGVAPDAVCISDVNILDLPTVKENEPDPKLAELIGQRILPVGAAGLKKFSISFRVDPLPSRVQGLQRFIAQVVSVENGPIGLVRRKAAWARPTHTATISFASLKKVDWEDGWHFLRVLAETDQGDLVPLVDEAGNQIRWSGDATKETRRCNESDLFYVVADENVEVEPQQRAIPREASASHALIRARLTALVQDRDPDAVQVTEVRWAEGKRPSKLGGIETLEVRLGREGAFHVNVPAHLAEIERRILASPGGPMSWHLVISQGAPGECTGDAAKWPDDELCRNFLGARAAYFSAISAGERRLITQAVTLELNRNAATEYAQAYLELLEDRLRRAESMEGPALNAILEELRSLVRVDSVRLSISDYGDRRREALLLAPVHPLRAIWYATWTALASVWTAKAKAAPGEFAVPTREALLRGLAPAGFPSAIVIEGGHAVVPVDNLNAFWSLYAPTHEQDPRGLLGDICSALGVAEPAIGGALLDGRYLASRFQRYLVQHPYVATLSINAFNVGRAGALAETLVCMQGVKAFAGLRYDIRLFVPDPDAPGVGDALLELLSPETGTTAREADAFSTPTESHLRPKLRVAIRSTEEFRKNPDAHMAHLSLLCDVFPTEDIRVQPARPEDEGSAVHGLLQEFAVQYHEDDRTVAWFRTPRHASAVPIEGAEECSDLLAGLSTCLSRTAAVVATGQISGAVTPVIALALSPDDRALLHQVHEVSDWVMTLDRNLGIEFFDHRRSRSRPDYLIDHSPDIANSLGHRLVITSRSVAELEAMLRPVITSYGLNASSGQALVLLDQLRSLSGRLALKLISSPNQRAESLGLALSRLFLEHQGAFSNQVVVPLDAHTDLYRTLKQQADELGDEVSFRRTDLALFDLDASKREITCRLVEVKCYSTAGSLMAYEGMKNAIAEQIAQSERVIAHHFDPMRTAVDRPDRAMKNRELASMLNFYLERAERYGLIEKEAANEISYFLRTLDAQQYKLAFTRSALIFDFDKVGTDGPDVSRGIEYYRIGANLIQQLIDSAAPSSESTVAEETVGPSDETYLMTQELRRRREMATSVPTMATAAFIAAPRDRTVVWDTVTDEKAGRSQTAVDYPKVTDGGQQTQAQPTHFSDSAITIPQEAPVLANEAPSVTPIEPPDPTNLSPSSHETHTQAPAIQSAPAAFDVLLGAGQDSPQFGLIGDYAGRKVAIDLNQTHTISLFGVQGGGKSYTLGAITEMAVLPIPGINQLPRPLATVIFHYSPTQDYAPEFTSMVGPNSVAEQVQQLRERYQAEPARIADVVLLAPSDKVAQRRVEYPDIQVLPLKFAASELQASHWRFLMGAVGNQATYIRQLTRLMRSMRDDLTLQGLLAAIEHATMPDHLKEMARVRLELAAEYIDDAANLGSVVRPGRVVIVDLRDEFIEKDEALGLFVVMLQLFADATFEGQTFNKLVVFDEAHKYIDSPDLVAGLVEVVREMRHKGVSIMVASQDPPSVPLSLIELSSQIILHKFNSPAWLKHIQKANAALTALTPERMHSLRAGEAYIWSSKSTDEAFSRGAVKIRCRPRVTQHGGGTRTAVREET